MQNSGLAQTQTLAACKLAWALKQQAAASNSLAPIWSPIECERASKKVAHVSAQAAGQKGAPFGRPPAADKH